MKTQLENTPTMNGKPLSQNKSIRTALTYINILETDTRKYLADIKRKEHQIKSRHFAQTFIDVAKEVMPTNEFDALMNETRQRVKDMEMIKTDVMGKDGDENTDDAMEDGCGDG